MLDQREHLGRDLDSSGPRAESDRELGDLRARLRQVPAAESPPPQGSPQCVQIELRRPPASEGIRPVLPVEDGRLREKEDGAEGGGTLRQPPVVHDYGRHRCRHPEKGVVEHDRAAGDEVLQSRRKSMVVQSNRLQVSHLPRICRIWRCRPVQCFC